MDLCNISPIEAAEIHFRNSSEHRHYPDDEFVRNFINAGLGESFIKEYVNAWRELWEIEFDKKLNKTS